MDFAHIDIWMWFEKGRVYPIAMHSRLGKTVIGPYRRGEHQRQGSSSEHSCVGTSAAVYR